MEEKKPSKSQNKPLNVPLQKVKGRWYQMCLWSGCLLDSRYGILKINEKKKTTDREGSFADAACAMAYITELVRKPEGDPKKISLEKFKKYADAIAKDLKIGEKGKFKDKHLECAPPIDPVNANFGYRNKMPHMYQPHNHIPVSTDIMKKDQKQGFHREKTYHVYDVPNGETSAQIESVSLEQFHSIDLEDPLLIKRIVYTGYKSGDAVILSTESSTDINENVQKVFLNNKVQFEIHGRSLMLIRDKNVVEDLQKKEEKAEKKQDSKKRKSKSPDIPFSSDLKSIIASIPDEPKKKKRRQLSDSDGTESE